MVAKTGKKQKDEEGLANAKPSVVSKKTNSKPAKEVISKDKNADKKKKKQEQIKKEKDKKTKKEAQKASKKVVAKKTKAKEKKVGNPFKFSADDCELLQELVDNYFNNHVGMQHRLDVHGTPLYLGNGMPMLEYRSPTVSGLAYYLGFNSRASIYEYIKDDREERQELADTVKRALLRIEEWAENIIMGGGYSGRTGATAGAIFWLKNHKWRDKSEEESNQDYANILKMVGDVEAARLAAGSR